MPSPVVTVVLAQALALILKQATLAGRRMRCVGGFADPRTRARYGLIVLVAVMLIPPSMAASDDVVVREVKGQYAEVKEQVLFAIENRGLVLNYVSHIGTMLERTGRDIGRPRAIYGNAELLEFCSAVVSRGTMEADPRNIVFCPYAIAVYTLPDEPGMVFVGYRKPAISGSQQSAEALGAVGRLLDEIVNDALK